MGKIRIKRMVRAKVSNSLQHVLFNLPHHPDYLVSKNYVNLIPLPGKVLGREKG
jgi:hypothetical protein